MADAQALQPLSLQPRWCTGLGRGGLVACAGGQVAHLSGAFLALHRLHEPNTPPDFFSIAPTGTIEATALAGCLVQPLVAIAFSDRSGGSKPSISLFDTCTRIRRRNCIVNSSIPSFSAFSSVALSTDGQFLAALTNGTAPHLVVWGLERGRLVASAPAILQPSHRATQCAFMPANAFQEGAVNSTAIISVIGEGTCRVFALEPTGPTWVLKGTQIFVGKLMDTSDFRCHVWLEREREDKDKEESIMAVGTGDGNVAFVRGEFVRSAINIGTEIVAMTALEQGGVAVLAGDRVHIIQQNTNQQDTFGISKSIDYSNTERNLGHTVGNLHGPAPAMVAMGQEIALGLGSKLWLVSLDEGKKEEQYRPLFQAHGLPLASLRFASEGLVVATLSSSSNGNSDSAACLMTLNCGKGTVEVIESYDIRSNGQSIPIFADLHPSGHLMVLTDGSQVRLRRLLVDSLSTVAKFPLKNCLKCIFSAGGHYFAAASAQQLQIRATYSPRAPLLEVNLENLGIKGDVMSLLWASWDTRLILTTTSGLWAFSIPDGKLVGVHEGDTKLVASAVGGNNLVYTCTATGQLHIFELNNNSASSPESAAALGIVQGRTEQIEVPPCAAVTALAVGHTALVLGCSNGEAIPISLPFASENGSLRVGKSQRCSLSAITCLALKEEESIQGGFEGMVLKAIVGASDGSLVLLTNMDSILSSHPDTSDALQVVDNVLVPRPALEGLQSQVQRFGAKLQSAVEEKTSQLAAESEKLVTQLSEMQLKLSQAEDEIRTISQARQAEQGQHAAQLTQRLQAAEAAFEKRLGIMEDKLSQGMREEATLRTDAERKVQELLEMREQIARAESEARTAGITAAVSNVEARLTAEKEQRIRAETDFTKGKSAWQEEKQNIEARATAKLESVKAELEELLAAERASVQRLRGECAVLRQRYEAQVREAQVAKTAAQQKIDAAEKLRKEKEGILRDLAGVKSELSAREITLEDKEAVLVQLTKKENELELKCAALSEARTAGDKELEEKKERINALVQQVEGLRGECRAAIEARTAAELAASSRKQRELAARKEGAVQAETVEKLRKQLRNIPSEIADVAALIQQPHELKAAVVKLYHKHAAGDKAKKIEEERKKEDGGTIDATVEIEELRGAVVRLQGQLEEQRASAVIERRRAVSENSQLLKEIHRLQEENEALRRRKSNIASSGKGGGGVDVVVRAGSSGGK